MMSNPAIEQEIREILQSELSAIRLSDRLFSPTGLFSQMAHTEEERRQLIQTPLFRAAHQRFHDLLEQDLPTNSHANGTRHDEMLKA